MNLRIALSEKKGRKRKLLRKNLESTSTFMVPGGRAVVCGAQKIVKTALENRPGRKIIFCFQRDGVLKTVGYLKVGMFYIVMMILM